MHLSRRYTVEGNDPFAAISLVTRNSRITNADGSIVFELKDLQAPESWSQVAVDVLSQKYFRKAGVPLKRERVVEADVPEWLQRSRPVEGDPCTGQEMDARQVFRRLAGCWTYWGWKGGYFSSEADAASFSMKPAGCSPHRWPHPIHPNGSIRGCTGLTESRGLPRVTILSTPSTRKSSGPLPLTNDPRRMPVSSNPFLTTW